MDYLDYKSIYNRAIETAKYFVECGHLSQKEAEEMFPELKESEDERIRKELCDIVRDRPYMETELRAHGLTVEKTLAYLEKQKEHSMSAEEVLTRAGLKPYKDGNQWCILAGNNVQEGICGFGDTIDEALYQFLIEVLEKQKENIEKEYVFRPLAGTDIAEAAIQAIRRAKEGDNLVLAFNGAYIPVRKGDTATGLVDTYYAYLEKQKEQKPVDDKVFEDWLDDWWKHHKVNNPDSYDKGDEIQMDEREFKNWSRGIRNMYSGQKPAEWSEEDEKIRCNLMSLFANMRRDRITEKTYQKYYPWLKSLRPQPHWKPTEEQMKALLKLEETYVLEHERTQETAWLYMVIKSLREQLLKLRRGEL